MIYLCISTLKTLIDLPIHFITNKDKKYNMLERFGLKVNLNILSTKPCNFVHLNK